MNPPDFQRRLGEARKALLSRQFELAFPQYEQLTRQFPQAPVLWFEFGNAALGLRKTDLADRAWIRAATLAPRNIELISLIGHQYQGQRQPEKARAYFAQAAAADPRSINPRISHAVLLEQCHQLAEARIAVEECLAIDPRDDQARYFAAVLDRRENKLEEAERGLRDLLGSDPQHPYVRYAARYELAQVMDRTDRFDEAIRWLAEAKDIVRGLTDTSLLIESYDRGAEGARRFTEGLPKDILKVWNGFYPPEKRNAIPRLAFLGGHPRSGTTLLEQLLDAHPDVAALDEPPAFLEVLQPMFLGSPKIPSPRVNELRTEYVQALLKELGSAAAGKYLVDKNPSPTTRLALWLRVFPELRVLIALRDPRDVVLSCYFQNIPLNATNVNFLSFERLARHYADLMDIWLAVREWEGFAWIETKYEDMVSETATEGRRVTEFLGLPWHESQTRFYEKSRQKQLYSPTYQDVTRPVYSRSVGRWHAYEKHLAPVQGALEPYCRRFGYN
ncbi:MAG TPA: sulfotransferase [Candidatus Limnocylindria bacterium]|jgi:tetratricopeptide (TPR) repeat protein|nr:sulfotransferase [Candidatus Limnocylindria bacterium]